MEASLLISKVLQCWNPDRQEQNVSLSDAHGNNEEGILGRLAILMLTYLSKRGTKEQGFLFPEAELESDGLLLIPGQEEREAPALVPSPVPKGEATEIPVQTVGTD